MYVIQPSWYDLYTLKYVMYALLALELSNTCICISGACFMNRSWAFISWLIGEKVKAKGGGWPWYPPWGQSLIEVEFYKFNFMQALSRMYFVSIKSLVLALFDIFEWQSHWTGTYLVTSNSSNSYSYSSNSCYLKSFSALTWLCCLTNQMLVRPLSCSHQSIVRKQSAIVIRQSWSSHQETVREPSGSHLTVVRQSSSNHETFISKITDSLLAIISHSLWLYSVTF